MRYTRREIPRGAFADAESHEEVLLLKNVSGLRLTYQIRLLTFRALSSQKTLIVKIPKGCMVHQSLRDFAAQSPGIIRIEEV
jgi:hypothetical protein